MFEKCYHIASRDIEGIDVHALCSKNPTWADIANGGCVDLGWLPEEIQDAVYNMPGCPAYEPIYVVFSW